MTGVARPQRRAHGSVGPIHSPLANARSVYLYLHEILNDFPVTDGPNHRHSNISIDMKKSYSKRAVPVEPLIRSEAQKVWLEFRKMPDRAKY